MPLNPTAAFRYAAIAIFFAAAPCAVSTVSAQSTGDSLSAAADKGRILGSDKAPLWLLIVSDFQCPFCRRWHVETWETLKKEYVNTGKIRVAFVNFPLGMHPNARPAAITAMCASAQGKFWPVADLIFKSQDKWKDLKDARPFFDSVAKAGGTDPARLKTCEAGTSIPALVNADVVRMSRAQAQSTPTFFIGRAKIEGAEPIATFRRAIDAELAAATKR